MHTPTLTNTFAALAALVLQAQLLTAGEKPRLDPSIVQTAETYRSAILAGDAQAVTRTYADDAVVMPSCHPAVKGRAAIEQYYRKLLNGPAKITEFTFSYLEATSTGGDNGYSAGTYKQKLSVPGGQTIEDSGKFVAIVRRTGGAWRALYVIYNSDRPEPTPATPATALVFPITPSLVSYLASCFR